MCSYVLLLVCAFACLKFWHRMRSQINILCITCAVGGDSFSRVARRLLLLLVQPYFI